MVRITKKNVIIFIAVLMLLVFIFNVLVALMFLLPPVTLSEILLYSIFNPLILIPVMGAGLWLILSTVSEKEAAIHDKYRMYLTCFLTAIALLSILLLNKKAMEWGPEKYLFIFPPVTIAAVATVFIAITTYMKRYYPYSVIFSFALLGIHYLTVLPYTYQTPTYSGGMGILINSFAIPILIIASGWWRSEKLGITYPVVYSLVMGLIAGIALPLSILVQLEVPPFPYYQGWEMILISFVTFSLTFVSGFAAIIFLITKFRSETANRYFAVSLRATLLLIVFLIVFYASYNYVFSQLYIKAVLP